MYQGKYLAPVPNFLYEYVVISDIPSLKQFPPISLGIVKFEDSKKNQGNWYHFLLPNAQYGCISANLLPFFVKTRRWQSEANAREAEICECDTEQSFQDTKTVYEQ